MGHVKNMMYDYIKHICITDSLSDKEKLRLIEQSTRILRCKFCGKVITTQQDLAMNYVCTNCNAKFYGCSNSWLKRKEG